MKFGSNICDSHCDQHTYAADFHLMTFRELTSGFDFWSAGHLRMAVVHLTIKFGIDIYISSPELLTFLWNSRWRPLPSWIFSLYKFGHCGVLIVWYLCSVPYLVQISVIVTEIDAHMLQTFIWWRHENLLPVSTFGHVVISASPWCIFPYNLIPRIFIQSIVIDICLKLKMAAAAILDFQFCELGHSGVLIVWYLCSVPNLVQKSFVITEIDTQSRKTLHEWKDNSMLAKPISACTHLSSTVSQLFEPQVQKNRRFYVLQPTFLFPLETPLQHVFI